MNYDFDFIVTLYGKGCESNLIEYHSIHPFFRKFNLPELRAPPAYMFLSNLSTEWLFKNRLKDTRLLKITFIDLLNLKGMLVEPEVL
jgi:hypothetical protein